MRRIFLVLAIAALMATMLTLGADPAFAAPNLEQASCQAVYAQGAAAQGIQGEQASYGAQALQPFGRDSV